MGRLIDREQVGETTVESEITCTEESIPRQDGRIERPYCLVAIKQTDGTRETISIPMFSPLLTDVPSDAYLERIVWSESRRNVYAVYSTNGSHPTVKYDVRSDGSRTIQSYRARVHDDSVAVLWDALDESCTDPLCDIVLNDDGIEPAPTRDRPWDEEEQE
jgi:hypothetical protein